MSTPGRAVLQPERVLAACADTRGSIQLPHLHTDSTLLLLLLQLLSTERLRICVACAEISLLNCSATRAWIRWFKASSCLFMWAPLPLISPVLPALCFLELHSAETAEMDTGEMCLGMAVWLSLLKSILYFNMKCHCCRWKLFQQDCGLNPTSQLLTGLWSKSGKDSWLV